MPDGLLDDDGFAGGLMLWLSGCPRWLIVWGSKSGERALVCVAFKVGRAERAPQLVYFSKAVL